MGALRSRMAQELKQLQQAPPPGVCAWPVEDQLNQLQAQVCGPADTVYEGGIFKLSVMLPDRYPFEPPKVRFTTPVYHPNIDNGGRICLDILNMPPKGAWRPSLNISTVLASIGLLLGEPNPDDGLVTDVTHEYKHSREAFDAKARAMTRDHARPDQQRHEVGKKGGPPSSNDDEAQGEHCGSVQDEEEGDVSESSSSSGSSSAGCSGDDVDDDEEEEVTLKRARTS